MAGLPIVKMTLYKHGVGFFVRRGEVSGDSITLTFRVGEMNDVLKSLTAVAMDGGRVRGIDYDTPEEKSERLARSSIQLSDEASLRDLLRDLRGRRARVTTAGGTLAGLVVGVDLPGEREPMSAALLSLFLAEERQVKPVRLGEISALALDDDRAAGDLGYFLETSLTEEEKRAVTVRLTPETADLSVAYIAPSPVWRVSYRLVIDAAADHAGDHAGDEGTGLLQGWGLFDNTLDEDLENVALTFISGMPVSFVYDLYTPFTPQRPVVKEQARAVAGPVEFEGAAEAAVTRERERGGARRLLALESEPVAYKAARAVMADELEESTEVAAAGQAQGEFFSYAVANPVTVRRGRSAMVPILQSRLAFRKERIYNGRKQPRNPVITARFSNATGLTLERGPLTVIEAGEYAGDAMLPFTEPGGDLFLAYAVDLGVNVKEVPSSERVLASVNIRDGMLVLHDYDIQQVTYQIENRSDQPLRIILEHLRLANYSPVDTPDPVESTSEYLRYVAAVPAHGKADLTARQRRLISRREEVRNQSLDALRRWLHDKVLDEKTFERLRGVLALYDRISEHEASLKQNEAARKEILAQQKVIQGNLGALRDTGEEGQLRVRYARNLQEMEDRLAALAGDDERLRRAIEDTRKEIDAALKALK